MSTLDAFNDLVFDIRQEQRHWSALIERAKKLNTRVENLKSRGGKLEAQFKQNADSAARELADATLRLPAIKASLEAAIQGAIHFSKAIRGVVANAPLVVESSLQQVVQAGDYSLGTLVETETAVSRLKAQVDVGIGAVTQFMSDGFVDPLTETYEEGVNVVCESFEELRSSVEEHLDQMIGTAEDTVRELCEKFDDFGEPLQKAVTGISEKYNDVMTLVQQLEKDVASLTEAIDTGLKTTGIGTNVATKSMDDIRAIMKDIV